MYDRITSFVIPLGGMIVIIEPLRGSLIFPPFFSIIMYLLSEIILPDFCKIPQGFNYYRKSGKQLNIKPPSGFHSNFPANLIEGLD